MKDATMKERIITNGLVKGLPGYREAVARMPQDEDVAAVQVGAQAPDCFGKLSLVTRVAYRGERDKDGVPFVHYVCALDGKDTVRNGCGCSNSMAAGQLMRSTALTFILNSQQCDDLEQEMR